MNQNQTSPCRVLTTIDASRDKRIAPVEMSCTRLLLYAHQNGQKNKFHGNSSRFRVVRPVDLFQIFGLRIQSARGPSLGIAFGF